MYKKTGEIIGFHPHIRSVILPCYRNVDPYYHYNDNCNACIAELLNKVYQWFEKELEENNYQNEKTC